MDLRQHILKLAHAYSDARGISLARTSTLVQNSGSFLGGLEQGKSCRLDTYDKCMAWFAANWPDDLPWPADVPRPAVPVDAAPKAIYRDNGRAVT